MTKPEKPATRPTKTARAGGTYGQRDISPAAQKSKFETTKASDVRDIRDDDSGRAIKPPPQS